MLPFLANVVDDITKSCASLDTFQDNHTVVTFIGVS